MLCSGKEIKSYKLLEENFPPSPPIKDAKLYVLNPVTDIIKVYITDLNGIPKELQAGGNSADTYINSLQFDTENGILTAGRNFLSNLNVSLDGRYLQPGDNISSLNNDSGYITSQFSPSTLLNDYGFVDNSADWNTAFSWGDHSTQGYLTSLNFSELLDYPADSPGALTNDGVGNLSWQPQSYISQVALTGNLLNFTGIESAFNGTIDFSGLVNPTPPDELASTQIFEFGNIGTSTIEDAFNAFLFGEPVQPQEDGYVLINAIQDGLAVQYLFVGAGGNYGTGGNLIAVEEDFTLVNNEIEAYDVWRNRGGSVTASGYNEWIRHDGNVTLNNSLYVAGVIGSRDGAAGATLKIGGNYGTEFIGGNPNHSRYRFNMGSSGTVYSGARTWGNVEIGRTLTLPVGSGQLFHKELQLNPTVDFLNHPLGSESINIYINPSYSNVSTNKLYSILSEIGDVEFRNGLLNLGSYGLNNVTGTPTFNLAVDASGNVIETNFINNNPTGLEAIDEGNGVGWRLISRDSNIYGNIGLNAVDFGYTFGLSGIGALGSASVVFGADNIVESTHGYAQGYNNRIGASAYAAFAKGDGNIINGAASTTFGLNNNLGSSTYNFVVGANNILEDGANQLGAHHIFGDNNNINILRPSASNFIVGSDNNTNGYLEAVFGYENTVSSSLSNGAGINFVFGEKNVLNSYYSSAFGAGHDFTGSFATIVGVASETIVDNATGSTAGSTRTLFAVGNGTVDSSRNVLTRSNAFQVHQDGRVLANSLTIAGIDSEITGRVLTTREWVNNAIISSGGDNVYTADGIIPQGTARTIELGNTPGSTTTSFAVSAASKLGNWLYVDGATALLRSETSSVVSTATELELNTTNELKVSLPIAPTVGQGLVAKDVNGNVEWANLGGTGLEAIDEGNGIGWRLIGRDAANYGNIGQNAVDFGFSDVVSTTRGATGLYSFNSGRRGTASGVHAVNLGFSGFATGNQSLNTASSGSAEGTSSVNFALSGIALGSNSFNAALQSQAVSFGEATFGIWGTTYTPVDITSGTNRFDGDRIFNIGIGLSQVSPLDGFTMLKDGQTGIGINNFEANATGERLQVNGLIKSDITIAEIDGAGVKTVPTKEWVNNTTTEAATYSATSTAITTLDCSTFDSIYQILTVNTDFQFTNTPAAGESFVKTIEFITTAGESSTFSTATKVIGTAVNDNVTVNMATINFANYPIVGLRTTVSITQ